jgi:multisubunit Na+/H+ antiporter MnhB subunit
MKKLAIFNVLGIICFVIWMITMILQVHHPHPYRGLIGNLVLVTGLILFFIYSRINQIKSPLYDPDKKKHIRNWVVLILADALIVVIVGFLYWKVL